MHKFPFYSQLNAMDCGPTCVRMVARYYGKHYNTETLRQISGFSKQGVSLLGISETAEKIGFRTRGAKLTYEKLMQVRLPCILHWDQNHFVVLAPLFRRGVGVRSIQIADPATGLIKLSIEDFKKHWLSSPFSGELEGAAGIVLLIEPTPAFYEQPGEKEKKLSWRIIFQYLIQNKWRLTQVFIALLITSLLQLIFPFLTQSMVDTGINTKNLQFITIVLFAQLMLTFSQTIVDFIRTRILLRTSNIINLSILSDFWIKLTRLPLAFFDVHHTGDTLQRIGDNRQIQSFLTGTALSTIFSLFNFVIYSLILIIYSPQLFFVFAVGSTIYFLWVRIFLHVRRKINYQIFHLSAKENNATLQLVQGMQEVRLNNAEKLKRWDWENIQAAIFKLNFKSLTYGQWQQAGALFINQGKNIFTTFLVARMVVEGQLTFGAMLAVQYIIGQINSPIELFVGFMQSAQDAKISMERLNEIHQLQDEEPLDKTFTAQLPKNKTIITKHLSFTYPGAGNEPVLEDINLEIPEGKVTAIVGVSGSGKTTLLKLLLRFYENYKGDIIIGRSSSSPAGGSRMGAVSPSFWRSQCGAVLQDGFIFNDTIAGNIAVGDETIDYEKLVRSCEIANIFSFIESLPNGFYTQLGADGVGISQGQKQRLLIARAVYKDPHYLFLDEATNALDANNEKAIVENLQEFFCGRTVVIVAHRLSTVKNADKIIVLHEGKIAEEGTHSCLSATKGKYYELVKNQLELGT